jgi:hypothetical protein
VRFVHKFMDFWTLRNKLVRAAWCGHESMVSTYVQEMLAPEAYPIDDVLDMAAAAMAAAIANTQNPIVHWFLHNEDFMRYIPYAIVLRDAIADDADDDIVDMLATYKLQHKKRMPSKKTWVPAVGSTCK